MTSVFGLLLLCLTIQLVASYTIDPGPLKPTAIGLPLIRARMPAEGTSVLESSRKEGAAEFELKFEEDREDGPHPTSIERLFSPAASPEEKVKEERGTFTKKDSTASLSTLPISGWLLYVKKGQGEAVRRGKSCAGYVTPINSRGAWLARECSDECSASLLEEGIVSGTARIPSRLVEDDFGKLPSGPLLQSEAKQQSNRILEMLISPSQRDLSIAAELESLFEGGGVKVYFSGFLEATAFLTHTHLSLAEVSRILLSKSYVHRVSLFKPMKLLGLYATRSALGETKGTEGALPPFPPFPTAWENMTKLWSLGIKGQNEVVSMQDSGLDTSSCYFYDENHPTAPGNPPYLDYNSHRKVIGYLSHFSDDDELRDFVAGHGTHVAGIIAGDVVMPAGTPAADLDQMRVGNGVAPAAKLVILDANPPYPPYNMTRSTQNDYMYYFPRVYNTTINSVVSSNSLGSGPSADYSLSSLFADAFAYYNPSLLAIYAAGNEGSDEFTVNEPSASKNSVSVGATRAKNGRRMMNPSQHYVLTIQTVNNDSGESKLYNVSEVPSKPSPPITAPLVHITLPSGPCSALDGNVVAGKVVIAMVNPNCTIKQQATYVYMAGGMAWIAYFEGDYSGEIPWAPAMAQQYGDSFNYEGSLEITVILVEAGDAEDIILAASSSASFNVTIPFEDITESDETVSAFSSRGPAQGGRIKPDLVAVGDYVFSAISDGSQGPPGACVWNDSCVQDRPGTSMATPVVGGAAALTRQFFREGFLNPGYPHQKGEPLYPSGALLKATLLASTRPAKYALNARIPKNNAFEKLTRAGYGDVEGDRSARGEHSSDRGQFAQGFGVLRVGDLLHSVHTSGKGMALFDFFEIQDGEMIATCVESDPAVSSPHVRFTLTWYDVYNGYSDEITKDPLVNNLDLIVMTDDGTTYFGNGGRTADTQNTVEMVDIELDGPSRFSVFVTGTTVLFEQHFSLVVTGDFVSNQSACSDACAYGCSGHGTCGGVGVCECSSGYTGFACQDEVMQDLNNLYNDPNGLDITVPAGEWTYLTISGPALPASASHPLALLFERTSDVGDPDYYIRTDRHPDSRSESRWNNTACDVCSSNFTFGAFVLPALAEGSYYVGVIGEGSYASTVKLRLVNSSMFECNTSMCSVSPLLYTSSSGEEEEEEGSSLSSPLPSWGIALIVIASALVAAATVALVFIRRRRMSAQTEGGQRQTERVSPYEVEPSSPTIDMRI